MFDQLVLIRVEFDPGIQRLGDEGADADAGLFAYGGQCRFLCRRQFHAGHVGAALCFYRFVIVDDLLLDVVGKNRGLLHFNPSAFLMSSVVPSHHSTGSVPVPSAQRLAVFHLMSGQRRLIMSDSWLDVIPRLAAISFCVLRFIHTTINVT